VAVDFVVEGLAQRDNVVGFLAVVFYWLLAVVPELHVVEEVKAGGIGHDRSLALLLRAEEDRGAKDALKALNDSLIVVSVLG